MYTQDIMKAVANDPKVLSILSKRKGQKGWRELQGDVLRDNLMQLIKHQVLVSYCLFCLFYLILF